MNFRFGKDKLQLDNLFELLKASRKGVLEQETKEAIQQNRSYVEKMIQNGEAVYGINTGFGPLCDTSISKYDTSKLQRNLLITHAVGVGKPIDLELAKIMMLCKVHALSMAKSGVRLELIERILFFIHNDCIPSVPEQGSVGASGDLAPLSHLFLPLIGEGEVYYQGRLISAREAHQQLQIEPIQLQAKEGLALINGTQFIIAHSVKALNKMKYLLDLADVIGAMSLEAFQGSAAPFSKELHELRPFDGSQIVAKRLRELVTHSENLASHEHCNRVQDPYSIRCMPQVHGASRNAWSHLKELTEIELNSVTDNPIILDENRSISGGNFHGQPLAMSLDYVSIAAAELGNISDRRSYLLLEGLHGLPNMLIDNPGLNSGFMISQYTTAALVTENKSLCFPPSADSVPTSMGQEDHVSMGSISGRQLNQILSNVEKILAIELLMACQAFDYRRPLKTSSYLEAVHNKVRSVIPHLSEDRYLKKDLDKIIEVVLNREIDVTLSFSF